MNTIEIHLTRDMATLVISALRYAAKTASKEPTTTPQAIADCLAMMMYVATYIEHKQRDAGLR